MAQIIPARVPYTMNVDFCFSCESCKPRPALMMPSVISAIPHQMCPYENADRALVFLKVAWCMSPVTGWMTRHEITTIPIWQ